MTSKVYVEFVIKRKIEPIGFAIMQHSSFQNKKKTRKLQKIGQSGAATSQQSKNQNMIVIPKNVIQQTPANVPINEDIIGVRTRRRKQVKLSEQIESESQLQQFSSNTNQQEQQMLLSSQQQLQNATKIEQQQQQQKLQQQYQQQQQFNKNIKHSNKDIDSSEKMSDKNINSEMNYKYNEDFNEEDDEDMPSYLNENRNQDDEDDDFGNNDEEDMMDVEDEEEEANLDDEDINDYGEDNDDFQSQTQNSIQKNNSNRNNNRHKNIIRLQKSQGGVDDSQIELTAEGEGGLAEDEDEDLEDDDFENNMKMNNRRLTKRQKNMMQKQKDNFATIDSLDFEEPLLSLPDKRPRKKKQNENLTEEQQIKKLEKEQKRRQNALRQIEEQKQQTIDKILNETGRKQKQRKEQETKLKFEKTHHKFRQLPQLEIKIKYVSNKNHGQILKLSPQLQTQYLLNFQTKQDFIQQYQCKGVVEITNNIKNMEIEEKNKENHNQINKMCSNCQNVAYKYKIPKTSLLACSLPCYQSLKLQQSQA